MSSLGDSIGNSLGPNVGESTGDGARWPVPPWKFGAGGAAMMGRGST